MSDDHPLPPFLRSEVPPLAARAITYLVLSLFAVVAVAVVVVHVPETVTGTFVVNPVGGSDPVRTPRRGVVVDIRVREGQEVAEGDTIGVIASEEGGDRSASLGTLEAQVRGAADALANARRKHEGEESADVDEERGLRSRIENLDHRATLAAQQIALKNEVLERRRKLREEGLTSADDVATQELEFRQFTLALGAIEGERDAARAALAELLNQRRARAAEFAEIERRFKEDMATNTLRATLLREGPTPLDRGTITLTAPCRGTVIQLSVRSKGAVVQEGDGVADVACATRRFQADVALPQSGLARVRVGQQVKLLYDAFPYERFGVRYGTVRWISPGNAAERDRGVFRVVVDPETRSFIVDGVERSVMTGMSGRAQIIIGSNSLLDYALRPVRQFQESIQSAPAGR